MLDNAMRSKDGPVDTVPRVRCFHDGRRPLLGGRADAILDHTCGIVTAATYFCWGYGSLTLSREIREMNLVRCASSNSTAAMLMRLATVVVAGTLLATGNVGAQAARSGNPILPGWYADPEAHVFAGQYWIYPTYSAPYNQQTFMDAFSSKDLITWEKHPRVLDVKNVSWARRALWAPSIVEKDGWYYLFFGANDIQNDSTVGGIGVARSRSPAGPFTDYIGKPLIDKFHNGAQPIDQFVFKDRDGSYYIVYGGWGHCNIAKLNADLSAVVPLPDGSTFKEITPAGYVEGAYMLLKDNKYYFMWSEGGWTGPNYAVAYAVGSSPFGPFQRVGQILKQDSTVATGAGHHSVLHSPVSDKWYIVYHRRPLGETDRNHRAVSIDELHFDDRGMILPVKITFDGVLADPIRRR
jgi:beta-xylosidase